MLDVKISDPYHDPEVDEWAARKIQSSFKQYKRQKTGLTSPPLLESAQNKEPELDEKPE